MLAWPSWVVIENYVLGGERRDVCLLLAAFVRQRNVRGGAAGATHFSRLRPDNDAESL